MKEKKTPLLLNTLQKLLKKVNAPYKIIFIVLGVLSTIWFIMRVIPKPSRASYPCMRAAAPFMSGFVIWLIGFSSTFLAFKKTHSFIKTNKYLLAVLTVISGFVTGTLFLINMSIPGIANINATADHLDANKPMGIPKGINPGRVVWVHNADATNENCSLDKNDRWWLPSNTNQNIVNQMFDDAILNLTGELTIYESWDTIFRYFNSEKGNGKVGYTSGESVFIKINQGWGGWASDSNNEFDFLDWVSNVGTVETIPQTILPLLRHLVDEYGIPEENIYVGDPIAHIFKHTYDMLYAEYPNIKYFDRDFSSYGRTQSSGQTEPVIYYSDYGTVMSNANADRLYNEFYEADYIINTAALKAHKHAGVTLLAKNHFGTQYHDSNNKSANHLHDGLISPVDGGGDQSRADYGLYRVLVDLLGHEHIGGKTIINIIDGLWAAPSEVEVNPVKWQMAPFNNDWPSSIFISQDAIALESVCFDFLRTEAALNPDDFGNRPLWVGVDDHLEQAADSYNWPSGINYDPEQNGTNIGSLGIHEHWYSSTKKVYVGNKYPGHGIELVGIPSDIVDVTGVSITDPGPPSVSNKGETNNINNNTIESELFVYPVPSNNVLSIVLKNEIKGKIQISVVDISGRKVLFDIAEKQSMLLEKEINTSRLSSGSYFLTISNEDYFIRKQFIVKK